MQTNSGKKSRATKINSENCLFPTFFLQFWKSPTKTRFPAISRSSGLQRSGTPLDHRVWKSQYAQTRLEPEWIYINPLQARTLFGPSRLGIFDLHSTLLHSTPLGVFCDWMFDSRSDFYRFFKSTISEVTSETAMSQ